MWTTAIIGDHRDDHVRTIAAAIRARGADARVIDGGLPRQTHVMVGGSRDASTIDGVAGDATDSVWLFRPAAADADLAGIAAADHAAVRADRAILHHWGLEALAPAARWINRPGPHVRASNKIVQLRLAADSGLSVPETLIADDPAAIRAFVAAAPTLWKPIARLAPQEGRARMTARISPGDLPADRHLARQPCFLQREIRKVAEWRVMLFGDDIAAVRQTPSISPCDVDWNLSRRTLDLAAVVLDPGVARALSALRAGLELAFGCVDLAEAADGSLHFLELNQMGRFLHYDDGLPQLRLAERFTNLLLGRGPA